MSKIEIQKVLTLVGSCGNGQNTFTCHISNLHFTPDEVRLKYISKYDLARSDNIMLLKSDLSNTGDTLATFPKYTTFSEYYDIPFTLGRPIHGNINFSFTKIDGTVPTNIATFDTKIAITFLFIKYYNIDEHKKDK